MVCSLASFDGDLYAATWEQGPAPRGRVFRLDETGWINCGAPWDANAVTRLAVHEGVLYAGVSRLKGGGSGLEDSANQNPGGRVLRYEGDTRWSDVGQLPGRGFGDGARVVRGRTVLRAPMYSEGVFRFDGPGTWTSCGSPGRRLLAMGVHAGALYGAGNDHVHVDSAIAMTKAGVVVPARSGSGPAAASSDTTAGIAGRVAASSRTRPSCTRSRPMAAGCTSARGRPVSCSGPSTSTSRARRRGSRSAASATRPRS